MEKKEQLKKTEVIKEINQLKIKIQNHETEKKTHIYNKRSDFYKDFSQLQEMETKMAHNIKAEKLGIQQQLSRIKDMVKKFQKELTNVKPTPEFVEKLKVIMEEIECHMTEYKSRQREQYEEIMREERITSQEVAALDKRFDSWQLQGAAPVAESKNKTGGAPLSHRETSRDLPPEVTQFERFVAQSGGPRGGWDEYDHGTFLKFRNRHKGKLSFLSDLVGSLPTRTDVEIRQHEEWYQQYNHLNDVKKEAIQKWKDRKEIEKDQVLAKAEKEEAEASKKQELDEQHQELLEERKHEQRLLLNRWKVEKQLDKAQEDERRLRQQLEKAERSEKQRHKQFEVKKEVLEYRKKKQGQKEQEEMEKMWQEEAETEEKQRQAAELIVKYRERDLGRVKQRRLKDEAQQQAEKARQKRVEEQLRARVEARVDRDPDRLLRPTAGWIERQKDLTPRSGGQVMHMPHRAVPTWRQGMH